MSETQYYGKFEVNNYQPRWTVSLSSPGHPGWIRMNCGTFDDRVQAVRLALRLDAAASNPRQTPEQCKLLCDHNLIEFLNPPTPEEQAEMDEYSRGLTEYTVNREAEKRGVKASSIFREMAKDYRCRMMEYEQKANDLEERGL